MSPTRKSTKGTRGGHFGAKYWEQGVDRCKLNYKVILERHVAVDCNPKEIVSISSAVWAQCMKVTDRQTNIQTIER